MLLSKWRQSAPGVLLLRYMSVVAVAHTGRKMSRFDCEFIRFSRSELSVWHLWREFPTSSCGPWGTRFVTFLRICEINYGELFLARERSPANDAGFPIRRRRRRPIDDAQQTFASHECWHIVRRCLVATHLGPFHEALIAGGAASAGDFDNHRRHACRDH
jgi:hypothetical protein